jgi:glycosyltransferase involved in cell wall biosynthesis
LREAGEDVKLFVGKKVSQHPWIYERSLRRGEGRLYWYLHYKWGLTETCFLSPFYDVFTHSAFFGRDIIHIHNLHGSYWNMLTLPILSRRSQIVFTPHDEWPNTGDCAYTYSCQKWKARCGQCPQVGNYAIGFKDRTKFNKILKDTLFKSCPMTIVVESRWLAEQIRSTRWGEKKGIVIIPNGIDVELYRPMPKEEARDQLKIEKKRIWLLVFLPRVEDPRKGVKETLAAISRLRSKQELGIMLVGGDGKNDIHLPFDVYRKAHISSNEELRLHYCAADVFILGTKSDNQPLSIIESMCCGTPVIASQVGGVTEMIQPGFNGWSFPLSNDHAMERVILEAVERPDRLKEMGIGCAQSAREKYSLANHVSAHIRLYKRLLNRHS